MRKPAKADDFLAKMKAAEPQAAPPPPAAATPGGGKGGTRVGLKHIGAYLDGATVEKVALLRARLALDNSQLVKLAVEQLYKAESAKRKFGD